MPELSRFAARVLPARGDLAAAHLAGRVMAARFVEGAARRVAAPLLDLAAAPDDSAERATQLLHGEGFAVYDERDGFAWGQAAADAYVGWVRTDGLWPEPAGAVQRRVTALRAHVYPAASIKRRPGAALPYMARVAVAEEAGGFARLARGGFVCGVHLAAVAADFVAQAERFLGVPYLWGGRSADGLDCSALVQLALMAAGVAAPRDSDMQAALVGAPVPPGARPERGDLVFWRGHVGIVAADGMLVHANAHHMAVTREPLAEVAARIEASGGGPVTGLRRGAASRASWIPDDWLPPEPAPAG